MSVDCAVTQAVSSYIKAMHGWETEAERLGGGAIKDRVEGMEQMFATG